ncbi:Gfo/Idh/MocA family oxidoreductase [Umezawaea endophytica]|uniref:Gfo/Idh/MocA family oxidoreductase n=1 Tax=Umezawaea endophytica TaxID=1654476 RepID=A0A9X2VXE9_9PSEU|nr:Gfo/Idh/MocA family oxidoreductase [Umezawaea endophytica]MCS7483937.1 Gfo/Idh/MocA family oxidoreductase [Umezawaea endophytica]
MADDLRTGVIGYGIAGRVFHAPLISSTPGLALSAIVTTSPERREQATAAYPDVDLLDTADDLLASGVDLVVIGTPNKTHVDLALAAIDRGIPVVVDKPFAPTAAEARRVVEAAKAKGVPLTVFQNRRWDSDFRTVQEVVRSGKLGTLSRFESRYERWVPEIWDNWREFGAPEEAGGLLYDLGAHLVDQALQLNGPVRSVYAELNRRRPGALVDDDVFVALTHTNGVRSHLWASAAAANNGPRFRLLGDQAAFTSHGMDGQEDALLAGRRPGQEGWGVEPESAWGSLGLGDDTKPVPSENGGYEQFYVQLVAALRDGGPLPVDPESSIAALEIIEDAFESANTGQVVAV